MHRAALVLVLCLSGWLDAAAASAEPEPARGWHYDVRVAPDLSALDITICFTRFEPKRLVLGRTAGLDAIQVRPRPDGRPGFLPNASRNGIRPALDERGCIRYRVDLQSLAARPQAGIDTKRVGRDLLTRPGQCLLAPAIWPDDAQVSLTFSLPPGMRAATGWPRETSRGRTVYRLSKTAAYPQTRMAFGRFDPLVLRVGGATLEVVVLDRPHRVTRAGITRWITGAASAVSRLFGGFPVERACLIVYPRAPGRGRAVTFGRALRAGGATVDLVISPVERDPAFVGEWMTVHELIHLGLPWNDDPSRWWGEGFVAYYQDVLLARMGWTDERAAWQRIESWMDRGRSSGGRGTLLEDSTRMTSRYAYHRVYYGGAAIAFLIDVELRRRSNGARSLDDVMRILSRELREDGKSWDGLEILRAVDRRLGESICAPIAEQWLRSRQFPDVKPAQRALGIVVRGGRVTLDDRAPRAQDRRAIMRFAEETR